MTIPTSAIRTDGGAAALSIPTPTNGEYSLYFHIPFCTKKCPYCHFFVLPNEQPYHNQLLEGLKLEWKFRSHLFQTGTLKSIYFGGGTPALFPPQYFEEILSWIKPPKNIEITIEANPENISLDLLKSFKKIGFNRISIGAQAFDDTLLTHLGRGHDSQKIIESIDYSIQSGFDNISIDLMYDLPYQTLDQWKNTLKQATKLPITHLSLYNLTIEPETLFFKKQDLLKPHLPSDDASLTMYQMAQNELSKANLQPYEISAFAKDNFYSQHNTGYWTARPFIGFGPSAYSFWDQVRFRNIPHLNKYMSTLRGNCDPSDVHDVLSEDARRNELLAVEIRLRRGVDLATFTSRHGNLSTKTLNTINKLKEKGWISQNDNALRLTPEGILFYDSVAEELI